MNRPASQNLSAQSELAELRAELAQKIQLRLRHDGKEESAIAGLSFYRRSEPTDCTSVNYQPELIVFVQGEKRINLGGTVHVCDGSSFLLTSVDLPVVSQVTRASVKEPVLAMALRLEMATVREILSQDEFLATEPVAARGMAVGRSTPELLSACLRLVDLLDTPRDVRFLGQLLQREILYRLLRSSVGRNLRSIATLGDQSNRTARAVSWLQANYNKPLRVEDLAEVAQMGVSTFHHHFRSLTSMSPLQYQKQLRLQTARVRMMTAGLDAATAAYEVGYESPSQFSREYRRLFGQPPVRDVKTLNLAGAAAGE